MQIYDTSHFNCVRKQYRIFENEKKAEDRNMIVIMMSNFLRKFYYGKIIYNVFALA